MREAESVSSRLVDAGHRVFLVGGIVRDVHLELPLEALDFDLTTDARPDIIKSLVAPVADDVWAQGEKFGTIGARIDGRDFEVTTHRAEWYSSETRKPEVAFGDEIDADLSRRDFTINAMAIELPSGELIDPFDGRGDLRRRVLRTPLDPHVSFSDDPLRILRAARFIARYDLAVDDGLEDAANALSDRMEIVSVERIREELDKLLLAPDPTPGLRFLDRVGILGSITEPTSPVDVESLGALVASANIDRDLRRLLVHSIGTSDDRRDRVDRLRYSAAEQRSIRTILDGSDHLLSSTDWSAEAVRRLVVAVGHDHVAMTSEVSRLRGASDSFARAFDELAAIEDLADLRPALDGASVMEALDLEPGPAVGDVLAALTERRLVEGPIDAAGELAWLDHIASPTREVGSDD